MTAVRVVDLGTGRIARSEIAYLRALADGVARDVAAKRYLGVEHGSAVDSAHRLVVERVAAVARRRRDPGWRLLGLVLQDTAPARLGPPLHEWAEAQGLDGWSERELQEMYRDAFGEASPREQRRHARTARLRARRLQLLAELEQAVAQAAQLTDLVDGWLRPDVAEKLRRSGMLTLGDVRERIRIGGRWWAGLPGYGPVKARHLAEYVASIVGTSAPSAWLVATTEPAELDGSRGALRGTGPTTVAARTDREAIDEWIAARASGSPRTAEQYRREAERFQLWMVRERGRSMSDATVADCAAYLRFLEDVPPAWTSRKQVGRFEPGWAPFRGPLSPAAQRVAAAALAAFGRWAVDVGYWSLSPWATVARRPAMQVDHELDLDESRAFTPAAWSALLAQVQREPTAIGRARLWWLLTFVEATGLRASELLGLRRSHFIERRGAWLVRVLGKGQRKRLVPVPGPAVEACRTYFQARGLNFDQAGSDEPLLATHDGTALGYSALHEHFGRFVRRALAHAALPHDEQARAAQASVHWLRHTHATRARERDVPADVLQAQLGHADPRTTARYYRAQVARRLAEMERVFGGRGSESVQAE